MVQVRTLRRRSWAGMVWLSVVALAILIAAINGYIGLLLIASATALATIIVLGAGTRPAKRMISAQIAWEPVAQRSISTAEGATRSALVTGIEQTDGYQMVLTIDGYRLIDANGQVVYTLKQQ
jgi:hypothetical protein